MPAPTLSKVSVSVMVCFYDIDLSSHILILFLIDVDVVMNEFNNLMTPRRMGGGM